MSVKRGLPTSLKMRHDRHYVEELASVRNAPIGRMISIDRLEPNPQQPRIEFGDLQELVASIREKGILEPLLVRPSQVGGRFMIISGERRYRAAKEVGLNELPCIEMDVDDQAVAEIALIENLQRKDLTAFEEADGLIVLVERFGYTHEEVAKKIGKARSSITEALSIAVMPDDIKELCQRGDITSKSLLLQVARQPDEDLMRLLVKQIVERGLTRDDVRKVRSKKQIRMRPFTYRYQSPNRECIIEIKFKRSQVDREDLLKALKLALEDIEQQKKE